MTGNYLTFLLDVMTLTGLWPREWSCRWVKLIYDLYSKFLNILMIAYLICKLIFTIQVRNCDKFMQNVFESLYLFVLTLERFAIIKSRHKIKKCITKLNELKSCRFYSGDIVKQYNKYEKWIIVWFASSTLFGVIKIFLNYKSKLPICEAQDCGKYDSQKRLYIEIWLPYDETSPEYYTITDNVVIALILVSSAAMYVFIVIIPSFVLEICCHFRILADVLRTDITTNMKRSRLDQYSLKDTIKYHQRILIVCKMLNNCFHVMVGLKLVFLSLPIIVGVFAVITKKYTGEAQMEITTHFIIQIFFELFVFCWFGEQLSYHSLLIYGAIYKTKWYEMGCSDRKSVLTVIVRAQRPAKLEIMPHFKPANLQTFIGITHFSYSMYSVLAGISR